MNETIKTIITDIKLAERDVKEIKAEIRDMKKIKTPEYLDLKKQYKILRERMKEIEQDFEKDLAGDATYTSLIELKNTAMERLSNANAKLQKEIASKYGEPKVVEDFNIDTEFGPVRVQICPETKVYLNGKHD